MRHTQYRIPTSWLAAAVLLCLAAAATLRADETDELMGIASAVFSSANVGISDTAESQLRSLVNAAVSRMSESRRDEARTNMRRLAAALAASATFDESRGKRMIRSASLETVQAFGICPLYPFC